MKKLLVLMCVLFSQDLPAQVTSGNFLGRNTPDLSSKPVMPPSSPGLQARLRYVTNTAFDIDRSKLWRNYLIEITALNSGVVSGREFRHGTNSVTGYLSADPKLRVYGTNIMVRNAAVSPRLAIRGDFQFRAMAVARTNIFGTDYLILDCGKSAPDPDPISPPAADPKPEQEWVSNEQIELVTTGSRQTEFGGLIISGILLNKTDRTLAVLSVRFGIYDEDDNKIGDARDYIGSLAAGESWRFEASSLTKAGKFTLERVTANNGRLD